MCVRWGGVVHGLYTGIPREHLKGVHVTVNLVRVVFVHLEV